MRAGGELCQPSEGGTARCSVMGKRAKRYVAENPQAKVRIARNGTMAALDGSLWDLKKDKAIRLRAWIKADAGSLERAEPLVVGFAGDLVVATMAPCAGPCAESRLFTAKGKAISKRSFSGVGESVPASGDHYFGFGQYGELVRIHAATKQVTLVGAEREPEPFESGEAALVNGAPTLAYIGDAGLVVKTFSLDATTLVRTREVPFCK